MYANCMNSLRSGVANCSSQIAGCTPVSQWSKAISLASCHRGDTKCASAPNSSKQNKKKRCGYQCRQKCQNLCVKGGQPFLAVRSSPATGDVGLQTLASARHKATISSATSTCTLSNRKGCARFPAKITISTLEIAKYPSATHSKGSKRGAKSALKLLAEPRCAPGAAKRVRSSSSMPGCQAVANSFARCWLPDAWLIPLSPKSLRPCSACSAFSVSAVQNSFPPPT